MTQHTSVSTPAATAPARRPQLLTAASLILGAAAFLPSGLLHPEPTAGGTALQQIYEMVMHPNWIPSAALQVAAFACFAVAFARLAASQLGGLGRALRWGAVSSAAASLGGLVYLFGSVGAAPLSRDEGNWFSVVMFITHLLVNPVWGLVVIAVAVAGGLSGRLGNRLTTVIGVVGGAGWTVAMATAPYLDIDDILFPVAGMLLTVWLLVLGVMVLRNGAGGGEIEPGGWWEELKRR